MVWTAQQTNNFFTQAAQMGLPGATWTALQAEGITSVDDLGEFDKEQFETIAQNFRRPPAGAQAVQLGASSLHRLIVASKAVKYYQSIGRDTSANNMQWNTVLKNFNVQHKALMEKKDMDDPDVPKASTKSLPIMQWGEAFEDYLAQIIGMQDAPLTYVIRENVERPHPCPDVDAGQPHAAIYESIEEELVARVSHTHVLYRQDNRAVYFKIEEAVRGTSYDTTIRGQPFHRTKDGRGAFKALMAQHAGEDKWDGEIKKSERAMQHTKWKGNGSYTLERYCNQHRNAYAKMEAASNHVTYQLPDEATRVRYLLDSIETSDARLQAAMASVRQSDVADGPRYNFEKAVAVIIPADPVARKR